VRRPLQGQRLPSASLSAVLARRSSWAAAGASRACLRPGAAEGGRRARARSRCRRSSSSRARRPELRRHGPAASIAARRRRRGGIHSHAPVQNPSSPMVGGRRGADSRQRQRWGVSSNLNDSSHIYRLRSRPMVVSTCSASFSLKSKRRTTRYGALGETVTDVAVPDHPRAVDVDSVQMELETGQRCRSGRAQHQSAPKL
jgi:hypothetical protein